MNICTKYKNLLKEHKMFKEVRIKNKPNLSFKLRSYLFMALSVFDSSQQILQIKEYKV